MDSIKVFGPAAGRFEVSELLGDYFQELDTDIDAEALGQSQQCTLDDGSADLATHLFSPEHITKNIASLRSKSAPSDDHVLSEVLAKLPWVALQALSASFSVRFLGQAGRAPCSWHDVKVTLLEKANMVTSVSGLRPISVLSVLH